MKLKAYLDKEKVAVAAFATDIGVSAQAVHRYLADERVPHRKVMLKIQAATKGAVAPNDFFAEAAA